MKQFSLYIVLLSIITLAGCSSRPAPAPVVELYNGKTFRQVQANSYKNADSYAVKKGDTLFSIAWQTGQDYRDIARFNNIPKPYKIYPGQQLSLKKVSKSSKKTIKIKTGTTSKSKGNQTLDPRKKQAYGEGKRNVNKTVIVKSNTFPQRIKTWNWPVQGKLIKKFSNSEQGNNGIDISNVKGTGITAAAPGKVVYTGSALRGYGNLVIIKHTDTFLSAYAHNDKILVKEQQWVSAGQKIALMGVNGAKTMLHFEIRYKGKPVDPLKFLPKRK